MIGTVKAVHLELTNKCLLKCPSCSRTTFIDKFGINKWDNHDLDLDVIKNFLDIDLNGVQFLLCGNTGDPIYYPKLFEFIKWAKSSNAKIKLITNGSYKDKEWWTELVGLLDSTDIIVFSIDGTPDNFTKYRINANWDSIEQGLKVVGASNVFSIWKYIPFNFNVDSIEAAKQLANNYGIDLFDLMPSDRWIVSEEYKPIELHLQGPRTYSMLNWKAGASLEVNPKCHNNKEHYISANGYYMPCCFVGDWNFYYKSEFYKNRDFYDISKTTISQILSDSNVIEFYDSIETKKPNYCTFNCPKI